MQDQWSHLVSSVQVCLLSSVSNYILLYLMHSSYLSLLLLIMACFVLLYLVEITEQLFKNIFLVCFSNKDFFSEFWGYCSLLMICRYTLQWWWWNGEAEWWCLRDNGDDVTLMMMKMVRWWVSNNIENDNAISKEWCFGGDGWKWWWEF